jgi:hypothetical protein
MEAIAIKIITVVAFYEIRWYHVHMQISPSYAVQQDAGALRRSIGGTRFLSE